MRNKTIIFDVARSHFQNTPSKDALERMQKYMQERLSASWARQVPLLDVVPYTHREMTRAMIYQFNLQSKAEGVPVGQILKVKFDDAIDKCHVFHNFSNQAVVTPLLESLNNAGIFAVGKYVDDATLLPKFSEAFQHTLYHSILQKHGICLKEELFPELLYYLSVFGERIGWKKLRSQSDWEDAYRKVRAISTNGEKIPPEIRQLMLSSVKHNSFLSLYSSLEKHDIREERIRATIHNLIAAVSGSLIHLRQNVDASLHMLIMQDIGAFLEKKKNVPCLFANNKKEFNGLVSSMVDDVLEKHFRPYFFIPSGKLVRRGYLEEIIPCVKIVLPAKNDVVHFILANDKKALVKTVTDWLEKS